MKQQLLGWVLLLVLLGPITLTKGRTVAVIHADGQVSQIEIVSVDESGVVWRNPSETATQKLRHRDIAKIDFKVPALWDRATQLFYQGKYDHAYRVFEQVARDPETQFYPAPGNYRSLALLRMMDCCRATANAEKIVALSGKLHAKSLPDTERVQMKVIACWEAIGAGEWERALSSVDALNADPALPGAAELGYIKGLALENLGRPDEAVMAYAEVYTLEFGGKGELAKRALIQSARLLHGLDNEKRRSELRAVVHTYAHNYNQGELWKDAELFARKALMETLDVTEESSANHSGKGVK